MFTENLDSCNHCSFSSTVSCVSGESERADFHRNMLFLAPFKQSRHQMFRQRRPYVCILFIVLYIR